jgi:hypothetical protein
MLLIKKGFLVVMILFVLEIAIPNSMFWQFTKHHFVVTFNTRRGKSGQFIAAIKEHS